MAPHRGIRALADAMRLALAAIALASVASPNVVVARVGGLTSIGDADMGALMNAWIAAAATRHPELRLGEPWEHLSEAKAIGALMFESADMAPLGREPFPAELAPYDHQFRGDMMKVTGRKRAPDAGE